MSLETRIEENTKALLALTAALAAGNLGKPVLQSADVATPKPADKPAPQPKAETPAPTASTPATSTADKAVSYDDVKNAALALAAKKGRDGLLKVLGEFGVQKATDLKPEQYAEAQKKLQAAAA